MADKTPLEEAIEADRTPALDFSDMSSYITGYRFSYWRAKYENQYLELVQRRQMSGETLWALMDGGHCFNKVKRRWEYEMLPSARSEKFLAECRMTIEEARPIIAREIWYRHQHARRKIARLIQVNRWRETSNARKAAMQDVVNAVSRLSRTRDLGRKDRA